MSQLGRFDQPLPALYTLTGNAGGAVASTLGNINLTGSGVVTVTGTPATSTLVISVSGSVATSFPCDAGTATPAVGALTVAGGTNIASSGAGSTVTINLDTSLTNIDNITFNAGGALRTGIVGGNTLLLQTYNNTTAGYNTFGTLTANLVPTFDLSDSVTKSGGYIYRAGGTDVPVADGGTNVSTLTIHGILMGNAATDIQATAEPTDGQLLIGKTGNFPVLRTITAGAGITVTNGAGTITISSGTTELVWETIGASAALVVGKGYICTAGAALSFSLPAASAVGDEVGIMLDGATSWVITQGAGQRIRAGVQQTTAGAGGTITSTLVGDTLILVCSVANVKWNCISVIGNVVLV